MAAFVKRGLTEYGNWFSVKVPNSSPIPAAVIQRLIQVVLDQQQQLEEHRLNFPTLTSDAMKVGSLGGADDLQGLPLPVHEPALHA